MTVLFPEQRVLIKGAGDLATGVAARLYRAGFPIVMTELARPLAVRCTVAYAEAIYCDQVVVEAICARHVDWGTLPAILADPGAWRQAIPVVVDPDAQISRVLQPTIVVDAVMAKRNVGTAITDAPAVIALGPGFAAGVDCHAVVETNRGHDLGRVIWAGRAEADTGRPGALPGVDPVPGVRSAMTRVLRAPVDGQLVEVCAIGSRIEAGAPIATLRARDGQTVTLRAPFTGVLRGLIHPSVPLAQGMKIGDLDPRIRPEHCHTISDKALAVAGGVLEAILILLQPRPQTTSP